MATDDQERVYELMNKIDICMLTTYSGGTLRARPMSAHAHEEKGLVFFLADARHHADDEIRAGAAVLLSFADIDGNKYATVSGEASVFRDPALVKELWSTPAKAWWESPDDPNIRVLQVRPTSAEFWDGNGSIMASIKMGIAAMTGSRPDVGEKKKVTM